ncbi:hypothetical protein CJF30_00004053 [Rutstroemia sp. NJR-2017a BBW]|nr:hypothetical protein CJF30_00004053 [Rutstroemia sp. NJR-2017a BBW]
MALISPFYAIILPFLCVFTFPLAIFASITTTFAFGLLLFRVTVVYVELALAVIPYYLLGPKTSHKIISRCRPAPASSTIPVARRRKRRGSASSNHSATGSITPVPRLRGSESALGLSQSIGPARDYEGVGGWRMDNSGSDDDALWTNMNSRLELPANHGRRHHQRSLTSGSLPSPEDLRIVRGRSAEVVMNTSKARTPPTFMSGFGGDGYFQQLTPSPKQKKSSSGSTSSTSSKASSVVNIKQR